MNQAQQALDLLSNKITAADVAALNDQEIRQLESICLHLAALIKPPKTKPTERDHFRTCRIGFFEYNGAGDDLFSVNPETPAKDALDMASLFLDSVIGLLDRHIKDSERTQLTEASLSLAKMAKAVIDSVDTSAQGA